MNYYLVKRKFTNAYYTVNNENNKVPSIIAFTSYKRAKNMIKTINNVDNIENINNLRPRQPLAIERVNANYIESKCLNSLLPIIVFRFTKDNITTDTICTPIENLNTAELKAYFEIKYKYM